MLSWTVDFILSIFACCDNCDNNFSKIFQEMTEIYWNYRCKTTIIKILFQTTTIVKLFPIFRYFHKKQKQNKGKIMKQLPWNRRYQHFE